MRVPVVAAALIAVACSRPHHVPDGDAIRSELTRFATASPDGPISMAAIAPGSWTAVYVFGPYTPYAAIARCIGGANVPSDEGIWSRDDIDLLIFSFADGTKISRAVPRMDPDWAAEATEAAYEPTATFLIKRQQQRTFRALVPSAGLMRRCP